MASAKGPGGTNLSTLTTLTEGHKRWIVFGIALNHILVPSIRPRLEQEILAEYNNLKLNHGIDVQTSHSFPAPKYLTGNVMKYENINGNDTKLKPPPYRRYDYSKFDYNVKSHVDFAKLFLQNHMAKFNAFDDTCDASAVLNLLGRVPIFSAALQNAANVVKDGRNAWGHCNFTDWSQLRFTKRFGEMRDLVQEINLSPVDEGKILTDLNDWEAKGVVLCMNATIDADLVNTVQQHVRQLSSDLDNWTFEYQEEMGNLKLILENIQLCSQKVEQRITTVEEKHDILQQEQSSTSAKLDVVEQRVTKLEDQKYPGIPQDSSYCFESTPFSTEIYQRQLDSSVGFVVDHCRRICITNPAIRTVMIYQVQEQTEKKSLWVLSENGEKIVRLFADVVYRTTKLTDQEIGQIGRHLGIDWNKLAGLMDIPYSEREEIRASPAVYLTFLSKAKRVFELFNESKSFDRRNLEKYLQELGRYDLNKKLLPMEDEDGSNVVEKQPEVTDEERVKNHTPLSSREMCRLSQRLVVDWERFAALLGVTEADRDEIRYSLLYCTNSGRAEKMLAIFNNMEDFSREKLAECLAEIEQPELRESVITGELRG